MVSYRAVAPRIPVRDLAAARTFYEEKLGLRPGEARPGGLRYELESGEFAPYESADSSPGTFTQIALEVYDLDAAVVELRERGLEFEEVDIPGLDLDGNLFGLSERV